MNKLNQISSEELIKELLTRDLVKSNGLLDSNAWALRVKLGAIPTVDSFAVRNKGSVKEVLLIIRNTGIYAGKWCVVGGVIGLGESIEEALRRHWRYDMNADIIFDWQHPFTVLQHKPRNGDGSMKKDFLPEPTKHSISPLFVVQLASEESEISFGATEHGGQEARAYQWFSLETLPSAEEFAYGFHEPIERYLIS